MVFRGALIYLVAPHKLLFAMNIIELSSVTKTFGSVVAVNDLTLSVPKGSIYGKELNGQRTCSIGYLPEERGLYKKMKLGELLQFHGELNDGKDLKRWIDYWLNLLDLTEFKDKKVETLSKGMKQKLQFIATILHKPEIIILDEPFSGLDPVNADIMKDVILDLQKEGSTIIFSTHDMGMAEKMCDYIFMIYKGAKVLDGTLSHIQDQYGNDTIRIQSDMGVEALKGLAGIEKINNFGKLHEIRVSSGTDPQKILSEVLKKTRITRKKGGLP